MKSGYPGMKPSCFARAGGPLHLPAMAQDPHIETRTVAKAEVASDEGFGLDRLVTAIAFLATLAIIMLSPFG
jgi:hypothetical protein